MKTQSQRNSEEMIKLQGKVQLVTQKIKKLPTLAMISILEIF